MILTHYIFSQRIFAILSKKMKITSTQPHHNLLQFHSHTRIRMTQSSDDGKLGFQTPSDQLQSTFRRRLITGVGAASLLSVGANFCGVTSFLLGFSPEEARNLKLDALYPVRGYSRYIDSNQGFEFIYPESWLGDQTMLYRRAEMAERSLDPSPLDSVSGGQRQRHVNEPVVAFGPPGSTGELNVSVIVAPVPLDFSMEAFGGVEEVGKAVIGAITGGSPDVKGTLIGSSLREDSSKRIKYYRLEFVVESAMFRRHNVAVCCVRNGRLFSLNAQSPESGWPKVKSLLYTTADSFILV